MWYLASVCCLLLTLAVLTSIGAAFISLCLPWRRQPEALEFLAPVLGLAVLLAPVTLLGWLGVGFRSWICLPFTVCLTVLALRQVSRHCGHRFPEGRRLWRLAGFAVLASFPILGQLLRFNAFNPFNDTWLYLYQAQWLQQHGFGEPITTSGHHPALVTISFWKASGLRVTPSFLLGWFQAVFGLDWSYQIYPAVLSVVLICGALAVGGIVRAALPGRPEAWWAALAAGVTLNGFACGAANGFFPQTTGLAFSTAVLALRGSEIAIRLPTGTKARGLREFGWYLLTALPLSLCVAAALYCYPEACPFLALALLVSYVLPWSNHRQAGRSRWLSLAALAIDGGVLASFEIGRSWRSIRMQAGAVTGIPVAWTPGTFLAHALGGRSDLYDGAAWFYEGGWIPLLAGAAPVIGFALLLLWTGRRSRSRTTVIQLPVRHVRLWAAMVPTVTMVAVCIAAFLYFRWFVPNPWPNGVGPWRPGVGQTWSQYKLSLWASPALLAVVAVGLVQCAGRWRAAMVWCLAAWCALGLGLSGDLLLVRVNPIRLVSGETGDPFGCYRAFCEMLSERPAAESFYLDATAGDFGSIKQRELLAYFLQNRPLLGDWTIDDSITSQFLPESERRTPAQDADWIVRYHADGFSAAEHPPRLCRLSLSRSPQRLWIPAGTTGGYDRETAEDGHWFYWTSRALSMVWHHSQAQDDGPSGASHLVPSHLRLHFVLHAAMLPQTITVRIVGAAGEEQTFDVPATAGEAACQSEPFAVTGNEVHVIFTGTGAPVRASTTDSREISFSIASAWLESVQE